MDYINYAIKQQPITGMTGFGGGSTGLQFTGGGGGADAFRGDRAIMGFAQYPGTPVAANINYFNIASTGNASTFGQLSQGRVHGASCAGGGGAEQSTRSVFGGGYYSPNSPYQSNTLDYITIANTGNATDFGDLNYSSSNPGGCCSNGARGIYANGFSSLTTYSPTGRIDYFEIATPANASDFGDYGNQAGTYGQYWGSACAGDNHRGLIGGTAGPSMGNYIFYVDISTTGNGSGFGSLTQQRMPNASASDGTRGTWWGNGDNGTIDYVRGANIGGFIKVADSMLDQGVV